MLSILSITEVSAYSVRNYLPVAFIIIFLYFI